jgi:hypothetical protein
VNIRASSLASGMRANLSVAAIIVLTLDEYLKFASVREAALAASLTCIRPLGARIRRQLPVLPGLPRAARLVAVGYG